MEEIVGDLFAGNVRHVNAVGDSLEALQDAQRPEVVTVCCGDSRVLQDGMWDNDQPGRIFTHSNIGNRVKQRTSDGPVVAGDVLYPLVHTGTEVAVVVGHTGCGAVTAAYQDLQEGIDEPDGIEYCLDLLEDDLAAAIEKLPSELEDEAAINRLVEYNVDRQVEYLAESDDVPEQVTTLGAVYDFHDAYSSRRGAVHLVNVDGIRDTDRLESQYPTLEDKVRRLWEY
jgi:carbonic anhydrase